MTNYDQLHKEQKRALDIAYDLFHSTWLWFAGIVVGIAQMVFSPFR